MVTQRKPDVFGSGPVEAAVVEALAGVDTSGSGAPLAAMALRMARAYDAYEDADLTKLARLNQELRQTLRALAEAVDDGDDDEAAAVSTPVWNGEDAGAADVGAAGGGGGTQVGQAADAASGGDL